MTALTERIAEVLREHYEYAEFDDLNSDPACSCGWEWDGTPFSTHVAERIAEALRPDLHTVAMAIRKAAGGSYTWEVLAEAAIESFGL